ncbi:MAG: HupE/UreJ family protein, partial [Janthinobacterium lividum]
MRNLLICLLACMGSLPAFAHQMPKSAVLLDFRSHGVGAELQLPIDRLQVALHHDGSGLPAPGPADMLGAERNRVTSYVLSHVRASTRTGASWSIDVLGMDERTIDGDPDLVVRLDLMPPEGTAANVLDLQYDVITRELVTHSALVSVRTDWRSGVAPDSPELIGAVGIHTAHLIVDRSSGSAWRGFRSIFLLGMNHIAEGTDHLLFLLTLLLPAPLCVSGRRWATAGRPGRSILQVAKIVSAFTLGHSVTLLLGALELVHVPEPPIEVLIAASILVSAVHAMRPLFPGREYVVAAGFGLVHGLSFAVVLSA